MEPLSAGGLWHFFSLEDQTTLLPGGDLLYVRCRPVDCRGADIDLYSKKQYPLANACGQLEQ
ncbi:hypothetical protein THAOC_18977, partial [Thalassiosira oceanica]